MASTGQGTVNVFNTLLTANDSSAKEELGTLRYEYDSTNGLKVYRYILAGTAIANGQPVVNANAAGTSVGVSTVNAAGKYSCRGVGIGTITNAYYGWILVDGYHAAIKKTGTVITTAYYGCIHLCGKIQKLGSQTGAITNQFTALETLACTCTTVKGLVNCL